MSEHSNQIDPELLNILRCPLTRSRLRQEGDFLISEIGGLAYPVRDGIPVMLIEEAKLPSGIESLDAFRLQYTDQILAMTQNLNQPASPRPHRSIGKWTAILVVWSIGLCVWAGYVALMFIFLLRVFA